MTKASAPILATHLGDVTELLRELGLSNYVEG